MNARTRVAVAPGGRVTTLACEPPLTVRQVRSDDPGVAALCLVGSAAGPLPGDRLALDLSIAAGARATLTATGATLAQGKADSHTATLRICVNIEPGGYLHADPGHLIVAQGCCIAVELHIGLRGDASVRWRELVVLGRSGDTEPGAATIRWEVTRDGRAVLRQGLDLRGDRRITIAGHRVLASEYRTCPGATVVAGRDAAAQQLADGSVLATVLAADAATAVRRLDGLS